LDLLTMMQVACDWNNHPWVAHRLLDSLVLCEMPLLRLILLLRMLPVSQVLRFMLRHV